MHCTAFSSFVRAWQLTVVEGCTNTDFDRPQIHVYPSPPGQVLTSPSSGAKGICRRPPPRPVLPLSEFAVVSGIQVTTRTTTARAHCAFVNTTEVHAPSCRWQDSVLAPVTRDLSLLRACARARKNTSRCNRTVLPVVQCSRVS